MITPEVLSAVFAAQEGNVNATQMMYRLVEFPGADKCSAEERCQKMTLSYELLITMVNISELTPNEALIEFLRKSGVSVTKEKYVECVNILRFYGYTLLVKFVENNWHLVPENLRMRCKYDVELLFSNLRVDSTVVAEYTSLVNQKAAQYIGTIAVREWPGEWKELIPLCVNSLNQRFAKLGAECKTNKQTLNEIAVFWGLISEISVEIKECMDMTILHKRRIQISNLLKTYIYDIFVTIHRVIVLGVVAANEHLAYTILSIFRNLSSILDGSIFISFDIDDFLAANVAAAKSSDVVETIANVCLDVAHKKIKNLNLGPEFDLENEQVYKAKLDRFLKNLLRMSEHFALDLSYNTTLEQLQVAQAFKNLLDRNSLYLMENVPPETMRLLLDYVMTRMVMHPSVEVTTCSLNAVSLLLRRILSIKVKKGEDIAQKLQWLDHKKLLLCLFVRGLKLGNPAVADLLAPSREVSPHVAAGLTPPHGGAYAALAILDPVVANITNKFTSTLEWISTLCSYCPIDEEISVGQMKNFEARFAALRSTILHCCSLLAIISPAYMDAVLLVVTELLSNLSGELFGECTGYCRNFRRNERQLNYVCSKYILFDGVLFILESAVFRLRSTTIDLNGNGHANAKDDKMAWLSVELYKGLVLDPAAAALPLAAQGHNLSWIRTALSLVLNLMALSLSPSHRLALEIRRLDALSSLTILFLYNAQFLGNALEFVVNKIFFEINTNISNMNKCALQCLIAFCKNCRALIAPYLEVIAAKVHQCLAIVTSDNSKDLLLEALISLVTTDSSLTGTALVKNIMADYVGQLSQVSRAVAAGDADAAWDTASDRKIVARSERLYNHLFNNPSAELNELNRRNLHRTVTMCYSIIRKVGQTAEAGRVGIDDSVAAHVLNVLFSFINCWRVDFFNNNARRKVMLSPGKDEWLSLQGFNEAIANEDNLEHIVESVFNVPPGEDVHNVRAIRRYNYILRQSLLKLLGVLIQAGGASAPPARPSTLAAFEDGLVGIIDWIPVFHLYQIVKYTLVPSVHSLSRLAVIVTKLQTRINQEWKSLNLFKVANADEPAGKPAKGAVTANGYKQSDARTENKVIHLYYLKVYACIDCGIEILNMCTRLINAKPAKHALDAFSRSESRDDLIKVDSRDKLELKDEEMAGDRLAARRALDDSELAHALLACLCSALSWPHYRTINEALRIMRVYAKLAPSLDAQLHVKFMYELILYLAQHIMVPRRFNPLEISSNLFAPSSSKTDPSSQNHLKEYVNTICALYEAMTRCFPQMASVVSGDDVNIQQLLTYQHVVETLKLLTPYLQEQDCILFIKYILLQKSIESRQLLKNSIQEKLKINNFSTYLSQFGKSSLETKTSTEIELGENEGDEDPILGNDVLYLLLE